jgi:hypothetical protein
MRHIISAIALFSLFSTSALAGTPTKEWTFLVFLNGHNNLDSYGTLDLLEMEKVGSTDRVNVVVQWASASSESTKPIGSMAAAQARPTAIPGRVTASGIIV